MAESGRLELQRVCAQPLSRRWQHPGCFTLLADGRGIEPHTQWVPTGFEPVLAPWPVDHPVRGYPKGKFGYSLPSLKSMAGSYGVDPYNQDLES